MQWLMDILCGLLSVCLLILCTRRAHAGRLPGKLPGQFWLIALLQSRPAMALGAMSYSVYLFHLPVLQGLFWLLCSQHLPPILVLATTFLVLVPVAVGVCYLFHLIFERPFMPGKPRGEKAAEKAALLSPAP